jgi:hypothetical protein
MAVGVQQEREAVGGKAVSAAPQEAWRDPKWSQYKVRVFYHYFAFVQMLLCCTGRSGSSAAGVWVFQEFFHHPGVMPPGHVCMQWCVVVC